MRKSFRGSSIFICLGTLLLILLLLGVSRAERGPAVSREEFWSAKKSLMGLHKLIPAAPPETTVTPEPETEPEPEPEPEPEDTRPMVALTFDDGPGVATSTILRVLEENDAKATFCVVGNLIEANEDIIRQIVEQGSEIASHTWSHKDLTGMSDGAVASDIQTMSDKIFELTETRPTLLRPPYGAYNSRTRQSCESEDVAILFWSVDPRDWETRNADTTYQRIMNNVTDGSIIICHDSHASTGKAMEKVIPELIEKGYNLVTASELIEKRGGLTPGEVYKSVPPMK